jgi:hypothetical protein
VALGGLTLQSPTAGDQPPALAPPSQDRLGAAKTRTNLVTASPLGCQRDPRDPSVPGRKWRCRGSNTTPSSGLSSSRWTLTRRISRIIAGAVHRFPATRRISCREPPGCATGSAPATSYETGITAQRLSLTGFAHSSETRIRTSTAGFRAQHPAVRRSRIARCASRALARSWTSDDTPLACVCNTPSGKCSVARASDDLPASSWTSPSRRGDRTRTCNIRLWRPALFQLSYTPTSYYGRVIPTRFCSLSSRWLTFTRSAVLELFPLPFTASSPLTAFADPDECRSAD